MNKKIQKFMGKFEKWFLRLTITFIIGCVVQLAAPDYTKKVWKPVRDWGYLMLFGAPGQKGVWYRPRRLRYSYFNYQPMATNFGDFRAIDLKITFYWVSIQKPGDEGGKEVLVKWLDGRRSYVKLKYKYSINGTVRLSPRYGERTINFNNVEYDSHLGRIVQVWKEIRSHPECPAVGYGNVCLRSLLHVAADPEQHRLGTWFFIPALKGFQTSSGIHRGYVQVQDVGGAIKGPGRLDIFVSSREEYKRLFEHLRRHVRPIKIGGKTAYLIQGAVAQ